MSSNGYNLLLGRFWLCTRGQLLTMRTISHRNNLPRKWCVLQQLGTLLRFVWRGCWASFRPCFCLERLVEPDDPRGPSNLVFYDSWNLSYTFTSCIKLVEALGANQLCGLTTGETFTPEISCKMCSVGPLAILCSLSGLDSVCSFVSHSSSFLQKMENWVSYPQRKKFASQWPPSDQTVPSTCCAELHPQQRLWHRAVMWRLLLRKLHLPQMH